MSSISRTVRFTHCNTVCGGALEDCKGHDLTLVRELTSDTVRVDVDGDIWHVFDEGEFGAIIEAYEAMPR